MHFGCYLVALAITADRCFAALLVEQEQIPSKVVEGKVKHHPQELGSMILDTDEVPEWIKLTFADKYTEGRYVPDEDEDEDEEYLLAEEEEEGPNVFHHHHSQVHSSHGHHSAGHAESREAPGRHHDHSHHSHHSHHHHQSGHHDAKTHDDVFLQSSVMEYARKAGNGFVDHDGPMTASGLVDQDQSQSDKELEAELSKTAHLGQKRKADHHKSHHKHHHKHHHNWGMEGHGGVDKMMSFLETFTQIESQKKPGYEDMIGQHTQRTEDHTHYQQQQTQHQQHKQHHEHSQQQQHHEHSQQQQHHHKQQHQMPPHHTEMQHGAPPAGSWYSQQLDMMRKQHNQGMSRHSMPYNLDIDYISKHAVKNAIGKSSPETVDETDELVLLDETQARPAPHMNHHQYHHHHHQGQTNQHQYHQQYQHHHHHHHQYQQQAADPYNLNFIDEGSNTNQFMPKPHNGQHPRTHSYSHIHKHAFPVEHWENQFVDNILSQLGF